MVWTGGAPACPPPNNSVKPPSALRLVSALRAPGFANSWARGMALARGEAAVVEDWLDPPVLGEFWASRLAFCSSTLGKHTETRIVMIMQ